MTKLKHTHIQTRDGYQLHIYTPVSLADGYYHKTANLTLTTGDTSPRFLAGHLFATQDKQSVVRMYTDVPAHLIWRLIIMNGGLDPLNLKEMPPMVQT